MIAEFERVVRALANATTLPAVYEARRDARSLIAKVEADRATGADVESQVIKAYRNGDGHSFRSHTGPFYVAAIKRCRELTGMGLKEAKDWCDARRHTWN